MFPNPDWEKYKKTDLYKKMVESGVIRLCKCCGEPIPRTRHSRATSCSDKCKRTHARRERERRESLDARYAAEMQRRRERARAKYNQNKPEHSYDKKRAWRLEVAQKLYDTMPQRRWLGPLDIARRLTDKELYATLAKSNNYLLRRVIREMEYIGMVKTKRNTDISGERGKKAHYFVKKVVKTIDKSNLNG